MTTPYKKAPTKEENAVIRKKSREKATPPSASIPSRVNPYKKVNSLTPTPPTLIGKTATTEEIRNSVKNITISLLYPIA